MRYKIVVLLLVFILILGSIVAIGEKLMIDKDNGCRCNNFAFENKNVDGGIETRQYALGLILDYDEQGHLLPNPVKVNGNPPSFWD